ncbi:MAG: DUF4198 domain-containing protein [Spirochaetaceae bacterium]|nr:DUF4198 domain-containing protein [Spirochaetaceae bacterium]
MKKIISLAVVLCALITGAASAHEFFVITDVKAPKAGDTVPLYLLSTHYFTVGEELEDIKYNKVYARQNGSRSAPLPLNTNNDRVWYETEFKLAGNDPVIIEADRAATYTCVFADGSRAEGTPDEVKAANPEKSISEVRFLHKVSKTYLNPARNDTSFSTPLGYTLEIVPLDNPARLKKGSKAKFRVLYNGAPLPGAKVWATYDYYDYKTMNAYEQTGTTDSKGELTFRISNPGIWIVGLRDSRTSTFQGLNTTENNDSIVVFTVP